MSSGPEHENNTPWVLLDFIGDDLDPEPLMSLVPLRALRPAKKGDPTGPAREGRVPRAKTGVCIFTTHDAVASSDVNAHLKLVLDTVEEREAQIKQIMAAYSLRWAAVLFIYPPEPDLGPQLDPTLLRRAATLGLPLETEAGEPVVMTSPDQP